MQQELRPAVDRIVIDGNDELVTRLRMRKMLRQTTNDYLEGRAGRNQYRRFEIPAQLGASSSSEISIESGARHKIASTPLLFEVRYSGCCDVSRT